MSEEEKCHEWIDSVMEQAQVFASAWSLVGSPFDAGYALETADAEKASLRAMLESAWNLRQQVPVLERAPWAYGFESPCKTRAMVDRSPHGGKWFPLYRAAPKPEDVK